MHVTVHHQAKPSLLFVTYFRRNESVYVGGGVVESLGTRLKKLVNLDVYDVICVINSHKIPKPNPGNRMFTVDMCF